jgi:hypothetical protein
VLPQIGRATAVAQVMIDSQGLMKVMHMITVHAAGDAMQRGPTQGATQVMIFAYSVLCRAQLEQMQSLKLLTTVVPLSNRGCWRGRAWCSSPCCPKRTTAQSDLN